MHPSACPLQDLDHTRALAPIRSTTASYSSQLTHSRRCTRERREDQDGHPRHEGSPSAHAAGSPPSPATNPLDPTIRRVKCLPPCPSPPPSRLLHCKILITRDPERPLCPATPTHSSITLSNSLPAVHEEMARRSELATRAPGAKLDSPRTKTHHNLKSRSEINETLAPARVVAPTPPELPCTMADPQSWFDCYSTESCKPHLACQPHEHSDVHRIPRRINHSPSPRVFQPRRAIDNGLAGRQGHKTKATTKAFVIRDLRSSKTKATALPEASASHARCPKSYSQLGGADDAEHRPVDHTYRGQDAAHFPPPCDRRWTGQPTMG
ncbi:hypothetical protein D9611_009963 [Ephemerocybe angulata]|uniref:Uncharacterized protein n=1 Tax=Ephemerocybe angulata TaxID=980116 RepID=A0A8H5FFI3_9AGAR|nr:hypothetical protein D9611_009963 [Tulosesus angulatus]